MFLQDCRPRASSAPHTPTIRNLSMEKENHRPRAEIAVANHANGGVVIARKRGHCPGNQRAKMFASTASRGHIVKAESDNQRQRLIAGSAPSRRARNL